MSAKHVIELQRAKAKITSGEEEFVCLALLHGNTYTHTAKEIKDAINVALEGSSTVTTWLYRNHNINTIKPSSREEMRVYRLLWIDQMIEYWRDK